jgi:hypothetical protein
MRIRVVTGSTISKKKESNVEPCSGRILSIAFQNPASHRNPTSKSRGSRTGGIRCQTLLFSALSIGVWGSDVEASEAGAALQFRPPYFGLPTFGSRLGNGAVSVTEPRHSRTGLNFNWLFLQFNLIHMSDFAALEPVILNRKASNFSIIEPVSVRKCGVAQITPSMLTCLKMIDNNPVVQSQLGWRITLLSQKGIRLSLSVTFGQAYLLQTF